MTGVLCGNRFGRSLVIPGGVLPEPSAEQCNDLLKRLDEIEKDLTSAVELLWKTSSVMARFESTGCLTTEMASLLGLVGPAARASGLTRDVRHDQPTGIYCFAHIPMATGNSGDVFARAHVRWLEIGRSIVFVRNQLASLPSGMLRTLIQPPRPNRIAVALVEGWRGEICHVALTDEEGHFQRYKVVDPSFHNWTGLAMALRGQQISDFPLCNKSFNLSYCGHDL
jgi:Ni,Fe-hydrogenase III large subunit